MDNKTNININEDIVKNTTKCKKCFSCLNSEAKDICRVELNVDDKIHFVKCISTNICDYRMSFGYSHVCLCPVRKEIFNRYNI